MTQNNVRQSAIRDTYHLECHVAMQCNPRRLDFADSPQKQCLLACDPTMSSS